LKFVLVCLFLHIILFLILVVILSHFDFADNQDHGRGTWVSEKWQEM
jgi:hypothetical protein